MKSLTTKVIYALTCILSLSMLTFAFISCGNEEEKLPTTWYFNESYEDGLSWEKMSAEGNDIYTIKSTYWHEGLNITINSVPRNGGNYCCDFAFEDINGHRNIEEGAEVRYTFDAVNKSLSVRQISSGNNGGDNGGDNGGGNNGGDNGGESDVLNLKLSQTSNGINVSWNKIIGAEGYYIWRCLESEDYLSYLTSTTSTNYFDEEVTSGNTYYYEVAPYNENGEYDDTKSEQAKITFTGSGNGGNGGGNGNENNPSSTSYYIKHPWGGNDWTWQAMSKDGSSYTYTGIWGGVGANINTSASDNGSEWYPKSDISGASYVSEGESVTFTFIPSNGAIGTLSVSSNGSGGNGGSTTSEPSKPTGLTATANSSCIELTWNSVSDATSYYVYRSTSASGNYSYLDETYYTSYTDCSITKGTKYYYRVSAKNSAGEGSKSDYDYATVSSGSSSGGGGGGGTTTEPSKPTGLTATANSSCIELTWNSVSDATSYYVYRSTSASGNYSYLDETYYTSYTDCSVTKGTKYYYRVSAKNSAGEGSKSDYDYATVSSGSSSGGGGGGGTTSGSEPCPPSVSCTGTSSVTIKWTAASSSGCGKPTSYTVKRMNRVTGQAETLKEGTTSTSFTDSQPFPGVNMYGVIASNNYGNSNAGSAISSAIGIKAPEFTDGMSANPHEVYADVKVLNVPDDWKPYYSLELWWSSTYSGYYQLLESKKYDDYSMLVSNNGHCYVFDFGSSVDFRGKTLYYKLRWVFEAPHSPSRVEGDYCAVKTVTHQSY